MALSSEQRTTLSILGYLYYRMGRIDSAVTVFGMIVGAAFAHNFALAGNPDALNDAKELVVGGIGTNGKIAVAVGFVVLLAISLINSRQKEVQA